MDQLNRLLWLKCRINGRMAMGNRLQSFGLMFFFGLAMIFWILPFTFSAASNLLFEPPENQRDSLHWLFFMIYFFWVVVPVLGYRLNGSGDVGGVAIYPVSPFSRIMASLAGSFLDIPFLLMIPVLVIPVFLLLWFVHSGLIFGFIVIMFFLIHTVAFSQVFVLWIRKQFAEAGFSQSVLNISFSVALLIFWSGQGPLVYAYLSGGSLSDLSISSWAFPLPCGIAAESIFLFSRGNIAGAVYFAVLLLIIAGISAMANYSFNEKYIRGEFDSVSKNTHTYAHRWWKELISRFFENISPEGRTFANLVIKDLMLLFREPQYRILVFIFLFLSLAAFIAFLVIPEYSKEWCLILYFTLMFPAVFSLGAISLNSLSLERRGLSYLMQSPVTPLEILLAKAVAVLLIQIPLFLLSLFVFAVFSHIEPAQVMLFVIGGIGWFVCSAGFNQIVAVMVPMALPLEGVVQTNTPGPSRALYQSVAVSLVMMAGTMAFSPILPLIVFLLTVKNAGLWLLLLPAFGLFIPGVASLGLFIAGTLFVKRQERLILEVVE